MPEKQQLPTCISCGLPVPSPSMGGTNICSWCDCGGAERRFRVEHEHQRCRAERLLAVVLSVRDDCEGIDSFSISGPSTELMEAVLKMEVRP